MAAALADDFGLSEYATAGLPRGGAISHRDRVSNKKDIKHEKGKK